MNKYLITVMSIFSFWACSTIPPGVTAVHPFEKEKYLGKWYEVARFDFRFEKGLNNTTAEYSLAADGAIKVLNRGYDYTKNQWKEAVGKAKFVQEESLAMLKVSFFGPFYAGYNVIAIDPEYQYALVCGSDLKYLWILSREKSIPDPVKKEYLEKAEKLGFNVSKLLWIEHNQ
jgi:apolipoprotein D and lipocalin family protein